MFSENDLVYHKERLYFILVVITSIFVYLAMLVSIVGIVILAVLTLFYWIIHNLTMVSVRKNGVKISEQQFPHFYAQAVTVAEQMNLETMPDIYVMQSGGILNAFAAKFGMKNMVVLYSDIFALVDEQGEKEVLYILAHEFAHIKRKHVGYGWLFMPGLTFPFLGKAYSRACEYTCDRFGAYYCQSFEGAKNALVILAVGPQLYKRVDQTVFMQQMATENGIYSWIDEVLSTHPSLPSRLHELSLYFNKEQTPKMKISKKGLVIGIGCLLLALVLLIFSGMWVFKQFEEFILQESDTILEDLGLGYDSDSMNDLMLAVIDNDMDALKEYAADEKMLNEQNSEGYTALHIAVMEDNYEAAQYLLQQGADPNTMDDYEYSPLFEAITYEDYEMIELLLTSGADKTMKDPDGYDAYQYAIDFGYTEIAEYIKNFK